VPTTRHISREEGMRIMEENLMPERNTGRPRRIQEEMVALPIHNLIERAEVTTEASEPVRRNRRFRYHRSFLHLLESFNLDEMNEHEKFIFYLTYRAMRDIERIIREDFGR